MSKKIVCSIGLVLIINILSVSGVLAGSNDENVIQPRWRLIVGEIISADSNYFKVMSRTGEFTLNITDNSRFWIPAQGEVDSDSLEVGRRLVVFAQYDEQGDWNARLAILLPVDFNFPWRSILRRTGIVTKVDQQGENFSISPPSGKSFTFSVNENTGFLGQLSNLEEMKVGMLASVVGQRLWDGSLYARAVSARATPEFIRFMGVVTSKDPLVNSFDLHSVSGEHLVFTVGEETQFRGLEETVQNLNDLQENMVVRVVATKSEDGGLFAINVLATNKGYFEAFDLRTVGRIIGINEQSFSILSRSGKQFDFQVAEETHFLDLKNKEISLEDLRIGMRVFVGAAQSDDSHFQAQIVLIR